MRTMNFQFETGTQADADFIMALTETVMRGHFEKTWGGWDPAFQWNDLRTTFPELEHRLVICAGVRAGYVAIRRSEASIFVVKLYLLPAYQNRGIGAAIMRELMAEARAAGKPLQLYVLPVNGAAQRFYERLGLAVTDRPGDFILMEYRPSSD